jgi:hypothetical protein
MEPVIDYLSGVCREYFNTSEVRCTRRFPQPLDFMSVLDEDLAQAQNVSTSHFRSFWNSFGQNSSQILNSVDHVSSVHVSAGLTVTSLVIAPIGLCIILALYKLEKPFHVTAAVCIAILDAIFVLVAAILWNKASIQYTSAFDRALGGGTLDSAYPAPNGLIIFGAVALAKLVVLPILAVVFLVMLPLLAIFITYVCILWLNDIMQSCASDTVNVRVRPY